MAEAYFNHVAPKRWRAWSAGSRPTGTVHPLALRTLSEAGITTGGERSKSWEEFAHTAAPKMDIVITVCDNAALEKCPLWPGAPEMLHWSFPDPAGASGRKDEKLRAFKAVFGEIQAQIDAFLKTH